MPRDPDPLEAASSRFPRPTVVVSQCLGFAAVRYNGAILEDRLVRALDAHVDFVQVCPEVGMGLGVPRPPIRLVSIGGETRLVQPSTGLDVTPAMHAFSRGFLEGLPPVDGFILKSRSPSCGTRDVRVYPDAAAESAVEREPGMFAAAVLRRFPEVVVEEDARLADPELRHHFLVRLFTSARLRAVERSGSVEGLLGFHAAHELLLRAYDPAGSRAPRPRVEGAHARDLPRVLAEYRAGLARAMARPPEPGAVAEVLEHAVGYLRDGLAPAERARLHRLLEEHRQRRLALTEPLAALRAEAVRAGEPYLLGQTLLEPYPRALLGGAEAGPRGR